jgi:hypothetical protein
MLRGFGVGFWSAVAVGLVSGCASSTIAYDGPRVPQAELAHIQGSEAIIRVVDDNRIENSSAEILPGEHRVIASLHAFMRNPLLFEDITISSKSDLTVCFTAYEGRRYTVKPSPTYSFLGDKRWKPAVFDERAQVFVDHPCVAAPPRAAHAPPPTRSPLAADPAANPTGPPAAPVRQKTDSE